MPKFDPKTDIPSLKGKVILITGGNVGLGKQAALNLAQHGPAEIWLAARNIEKTNAAITEIQKAVPGATRFRALKLDLSSLDSVRSAAQEFLSAACRLDVLMLNAGIMAVPPGLTQDGYEVQFGVNHVGHAYLVKLLLSLLQKTAAEPSSDVRIVSLSSMGHKYVPKGGILFDTLRTPAENIPTSERYGQSKLANILYAKALAKRYPEIKTVAVHPGIVKTDLHAKTDGGLLVCFFEKAMVPLLGVSVEDGAKNQVWAATAGEGVVSGEYYAPVGVTGGVSRLASDEKLVERLWEWTEKELKSWGV